METDLLSLVETLSQLEQDASVPKNIKTKLQLAITMLKEDGKDMKITANRVLQQLEEVSDDPNMPSYIRPQIWNIVSLLEGF